MIDKREHTMDLNEEGVLRGWGLNETGFGREQGSEGHSGCDEYEPFPIPIPGYAFSMGRNPALNSS